MRTTTRPVDNTIDARTVVVVEDSGLVLKSTLRVLRASGVKAVGFVSSAEAVAAIAQSRPAAVITDFAMPQLDGVGVRNAIREHFGDKAPPIVLVTGCGMSVPEGELDEFDGWLEKPYDGHDLRRTLRAVVR